MGDVVARTDWKAGDAVTSYFSDYVGIVVEILHHDETLGPGGPEAIQELALVYWPDCGPVPVNFLILRPAF